MANTTVLQEQAIQALNLSEELYRLPVNELAKNTKQLSELTAFYIRKEPSPLAVSRMKKALNVGTEDFPVFQVIEPFIFWKNADGVLFTISGNTRRRSLIELLNEKTISGDDAYHLDSFEDIPYRLLLTEPTTDILLDIQLSTNDNTTPHSPIELAEKAEAYKEEKYRLYMSKPNAQHKDAKAYSTRAVCQKFDITDAYLSQLKKLLNYCADEKNVLLKNMINDGDIAPATAVKLIGGLARYTVSLEQVIPALRSQLGYNENRITDKHLKGYFDTLKNIESGSGADDDIADSSSDNIGSGIPSSGSTSDSSGSGEASNDTGGDTTSSTTTKKSISFEAAVKDFEDFLCFLRGMPEIHVGNMGVAYDLLKLYFELLETTSDRISSSHTNEIFQTVVNVILTRFSRLGDDKFNKELFNDDKERDGIDKIIKKINKNHAQLTSEPATTEDIPDEEIEPVVIEDDEKIQMAMIA